MSDLANASLSWDCLDWKIDGVCVFLRCGIFGCYIVTTPRISHPTSRIWWCSPMPIPPKRRGRNGSHWPKAAAQAASSALQGTFGTQLTGGSGSGTGPHRYTDLLQFFETDVVGNPIAKILKFGKFLCRSDVSPMKPYFVSVTDALAWRSGARRAQKKGVHYSGTARDRHRSGIDLGTRLSPVGLCHSKRSCSSSCGHRGSRNRHRDQRQFQSHGAKLQIIRKRTKMYGAVILAPKTP